MKRFAMRWLFVALLPGCLLVQPLDDAKSDSDGSGGSGPGSAGRPATGGAGPMGGRGGSPPGSAGAPAGPLSAFTGIWVLTGGTLTLECGGDPTTVALTDGSADWQKGTTTDLVQTSEGTNCELLANVSGRVARNVDSQTCTESGLNDQGTPYSQDLTIDSYTFTIDASGDNAMELFSGTIDYTDLTTFDTATCNFIQTGSYYKQ